MYDSAAGVEDSNGAISIYYELSALVKTINLPINNWASSSEDLKGIWKAEFQEIQRRTQALGVDWNKVCDTLPVDSRDFQNKTIEGPATKRQFIQTTARFYDPLGLFTPVSAIAKIFLQETWCRGMQCKLILPHDIGTRWHAWITSLPLLADIDIPRWMGTSKGHDTQTHVFCETSERAYGAVLYVRSSTHEGVIVRLACSKSRLAPVKKIALTAWNFSPRL